MNVELLEQICETIMQENTLFSMDLWFRKRDGSIVHPSCPDDYCGTVCCIAGHAIKYGCPNGIADMVITEGAVYSNLYSNLACSLLQLSREEGERLFYISFWPSNYLNAYYETDLPRLRAKAAVNRIQHFIETGE